MIALPFNDYTCLGSITEVIRELVTNEDPVIVELAKQHPTTRSLVRWIRSLPQRDDDGAKNDGPKVDACEPPQRLRVPADDPNCVERAAMYLAIAELIDPQPVRQLATLDLPIGLHTFPVENGAPVILDPNVPRNCVACGLACEADGPVAVDARDAIEWTSTLAEAGAVPRNGPSRRKLRRARNAVLRLVNEGAAPAHAGDIGAIGWMFALAERAARKYGARAISIVRTTARAIADLLDQALERRERNLALEIGGFRLEPSPWMSQLAKIAANVGVDIGASVLRSELGSFGIGDDVFNLVEQEANKQGMTLGPLAHPPKLPTFASLQQRAA
ncbi:MAG TPA: hypothetical protein VMJ10_06170 [Kofleriaceae bacterium]|nr:hypothetical protein [Kofleriaceae bacterium]